ncbi:hypothetical protein [Gellertiella hungarica]|uniref:Uncharacterized protein n=1 Tax=Gellertiella hungarica TaxID=1572859 RepID=A0A7W6NM36_9HYPH|nr:hypothetical protein [Gellertiella hungarica]MBB4067175.1 hypothetical protein [Gellertiella hungarica]
MKNLSFKVEADTEAFERAVQERFIPILREAICEVINETVRNFMDSLPFEEIGEIKLECAE